MTTYGAYGRVDETGTVNEPVNYKRRIGVDLPGRCRKCGFHPTEQGHRSPCKPEGLGLILERPTIKGRLR